LSLNDPRSAPFTFPPVGKRLSLKTEPPVRDKVAINSSRILLFAMAESAALQSTSHDSPSGHGAEQPGPFSPTRNANLENDETLPRNL
jgi:hypothetical protein